MSPPRLIRYLLQSRARRLPRHEQSPDLWLLIGLLLTAIFVIDLLLPLGVAAGVPYVAPVLLALWLPGKRSIMLIASIATCLTFVGYLLSEPWAPPWTVIPNRIIAVAAVWAVAGLALQRRKLELSLSDSEALARAVLASTADGILTVDERGVIRSANRAAEKIFGYLEEMLLSRPLHDLLDAGHAAPDTGDLFRILLDDLVHTHEVAARRADGTLLSVEILLVPLELASGVRYTVTIRDVSKRRMVERHVLRTQDEERREIGYGLHEKLGQALTGMHLISRHLARSLEARHAPEAAYAAELAEQLRQTDSLALQLFDGVVPVNARGGFAAAVRRAIEDEAPVRGLEWSLVEGEVDDDPHAGQLDGLYRIALEFIRESVRLASPTRMDVELARSADCPLAVRLSGVAVSDPDAWALAIDRLRYRAKLVDGHLRVTRPADDALSISVLIRNGSSLSMLNGLEATGTV